MLGEAASRMGEEAVGMFKVGPFVAGVVSRSLPCSGARGWPLWLRGRGGERQR